MDRFCLLAMEAAEEAARDCGVDFASGDPTRRGVVIGSGVGGIQTIEAGQQTLSSKGPARMSPFIVPKLMVNAAAGNVSIRFDLQGANNAVATACATGGHAIGTAFHMIQRGDADVIFAGGSEAACSPLCISSFAAMKALSTRNDDPATASRPFDAHRDGFVLGEGAGVLVLESLQHAQDRGATIHGELAAFGQSADAYHLTAPAPEGAGAQLAMRHALEQVGIGPQDVGYINAHGTSTPANDLNETLAVKAVFGDHAYELVIGSTKSMTGHLLGGAGGVETVIATLVCATGEIPPTINFEEQDPECDLDYAHQGRVERPVEVALTNSFGFGGHNVCLAVRRWDT